MSIFFSFCIECREVTHVGKRICKSFALPGERTLATGFLTLFFLCGGLLGCLFFGVCGDSGSRSLTDYLVDYLRLTHDAGVSGSAVVFWSELRFGLIALLLWWASFGVVTYPVLFAFRGFLLAFSVGAFAHVFGIKGAVCAGVLFLLPALFWGPALFLLGSRGLCRGGKPLSLDREELRELFLACVLFVMCGILEYAILPRLLPYAAEIVL